MSYFSKARVELSTSSRLPEPVLFDKQVSVGEELFLRALHTLTDFEVLSPLLPFLSVCAPLSSSIVP